VSGSGISWAICKSAPHPSIVFTGRMPFLLPNQQRQSTEGNNLQIKTKNKTVVLTQSITTDSGLQLIFLNS